MVLLRRGQPPHHLRSSPARSAPADAQAPHTHKEATVEQNQHSSAGPLRLSTHDLAVARYMCNRIAVMYLGKIVELAEALIYYYDSADSAF